MAKAFYKDIILEIAEGVYEPREDSFLLAEAFEKEIKTKKYKNILDLGCGSGLLAIIAAKKGCKVTAADIEKKTLECAEKNAAENSAEISFVLSDLSQNVSGKFDMIVFNPPYLPEKISADARVWAAGENSELIIRAISSLKDSLESDGKFLMVASSLSGIEEILKKFEDEGFIAAVTSEKKIPWETLCIISAIKRFYK
ncbi:MAG TPA: HemK2/MTQ2 family protein methyltransferase [archaeon]|nr:HemK2/MTQ2 family protein methyltransferase [archaeon]